MNVPVWMMRGAVASALVLAGCGGGSGDTDRVVPDTGPASPPDTPAAALPINTAGPETLPESLPSEDGIDYVAIIRGGSSEVSSGTTNPGDQSSDHRTEIRLRVKADFYQLHEPLSEAALLAAVSPEPPGCSVHEGSPLDTQPFMLPETIGRDSVGAGEVLTLMSEHGTLPELNYDDPMASGSYSTPSPYFALDYFTAKPSDLIVDVPGDAFPSWAGIWLPVRDRPLLLEGDRRPGQQFPYRRTPQQLAFEWRSNAQPDTQFLFKLVHIDPDTGQESSISCRVADTGRFDGYSEEILSEVDRTQYDNRYFAHVGMRVERRDNVLLLVSFEGFANAGGLTRDLVVFEPREASEK